MLSNEGGGVRQIGQSAAEGRLYFWWNILLRLALIGLGGYVLWRVRTILTTVIVALVLSSAASALVALFMRKRIYYLRPHTQRFAATVLVYALLFLAFFGSIKLLISPFQTEIGKLVHNWPEYQVTLENTVDRVQDWYTALPPDVRALLDEQKAKMSVASPETWLAGFLKTTVGWASHIVELILIPVLAFYFTLDGRKLRNQFLFLVPDKWLRPTFAIFSEGGAIMRAYIVSQFWLAAIAGVVVGVGLKLVGMDYAVILGLFAGITRAIPVVGPLLGGIPIVLLSFVYGAQTNNPYLWVYLLIGFTCLHLVESKVVMPKFLGHALNLHAVVIIIVLLIGGEFFGLMGMFLAAPVTALGRVLLEHYVIRPRRRTRPVPVVAHAHGGGGNGGSSGGTRVLRLERTARTVNGSYTTAPTKAASHGGASSAPIAMNPINPSEE
jgi:predicted PurR-regulated permease PerM